MHAVVPEIDWRTTHMTRRRIAWMLILIVDAGYVAWGAGAAAFSDHLLGPWMCGNYNGLFGLGRSS
jgi:fatty acid desaturase